MLIKRSVLFPCLVFLLALSVSLIACDAGHPTKSPEKTFGEQATARVPPMTEFDDIAPDTAGTETRETETSAEEEIYDPAHYVVIRTPEDLMAFHTSVNEEGVAYKGMTMVILDDLDMTGYSWAPLNSDGLAGMTFDGKGHAISHLRYADHAPVGGTAADQIGAGFIGVNKGHLTFRDLTFSDCSIAAYERAVGCIIGLNLAPNSSVTFEHVAVDGFTADGWMDYNHTVFEDTHPISFHMAGFVGHNMEGSLRFSNCAVRDISLSGFHNLAAFVGYDGADTVNEFCFTDCSVENADLTFSYCVSASYHIDQPKKFVSVFYNAANWADNIDAVAATGNTYTGVVYYDWSDDLAVYYPDNLRSWSREEAGH